MSDRFSPLARNGRTGLSMRNNRLVFSFGVLCLMLGASLPANAQLGSRVPRAEYYFARHAFYMGEYTDAEKGFLRGLKSGIRIGQSRWIDSVCYYTMLGEVNFHRGNFVRALEFHELAIQVHMANPGWMGRLKYPRIVPSGDRVQVKIGWGNTGRVMGQFPETMSSLEGSIDQQSAFEFGGAVNKAHTRRVDGVEVVRCLAVSLRRRAELLGPTASLSPSSSRIVNSFANIIVPPGHWVAAWVEVLYGLALVGDGQTPEGAAHIASGVTMGNVDHPLTGIAFLELGKYQLRAGKYKEAMVRLREATVAAALFRQADVVEESFRYLTDAFLASDGQDVMLPVLPAVAFAESEEFVRLAASLRMNMAELAVYSNAPASANGLLNQARALMRRRELLLSDLGARLAYLDAITQYRGGNTKAANASMKLALAYMQGGSMRRFHLGTLERLHAAGRRAISPRNAEILYSRMLREPSDIDWRTDPLETISMLLSKQTGSIERWFELLVDRKEYDKAVRVAEQLKRHRFYSSLPFGGRILSLRWLIEGDKAMLGNIGMEQKTHLRDKYPVLARHSRRAEQIRAKLQQEKIVPTEESRDRQKSLYSELKVISEQLENTTREIALRREPAKLVFPPQPSLSAIQRGMRDNQAVLMFVTTSQGWHTWFIRKKQNEYWSIRSPIKVRRIIAKMLRDIGNRGRNTVLAADDVQNDNWKSSAKALWKGLIGELPSHGWEGLEELVIIPDGVLWYVPFEVLQVPAAQLEGEEEDASLISQVRIRYAPVASLSVGDQRGHAGKLKTTVVGGQLFPRESSEHAGEMLAKWKTNIDELEVIAKNKPLAPSRFTSGVMERLIVWNDISVGAKNPYKWAPAQYDRGADGALLTDWLEYPWGAPQQIILPGFHTSAESPLSSSATGNEVFLTACGLMATGTRTALLARWRTGGRTPAVLIREFALELPEAGASEAWRTALELARVETLDTKIEPRLRPVKEITEVSADHPFFWAGYLLVDSGAEPQEEAKDESKDAADDAAAPEEAAPADAENTDNDTLDEKVPAILEPAFDVDVDLVPLDKLDLEPQLEGELKPGD